jgi:5-keto-L-gluconate epimerase
MKLSICIQTPEVKPNLPVALVAGSFQEKLAKISGWGARGVELMSVDPKALSWNDIKSRLKENGLQPSAVASGGLGFALGLNLLHADPDIMAQAKSRLYDLIEMAGEIGAPVVTIGSFRGRLANFPGDGKAALEEILRIAGHFAQQRGVRLAIEPLNRYEGDFILNAEQGLDFVAQVDHPAVGLLLDTYHVNIEECSWTEPFERVMRAGRLFHVHLGDNNRLPPGKGLIDFHAIVRTLSQTGYQGYLSAELLPKPDPDAAAEHTIHYIRAIMGQEGAL